MAYTEKLRKLRSETGVSGRKFADLIGVTWDQYKSWEYTSKKEYMPIEMVLKVLPVFVSLGVDHKRVWELAGVSPDIFKKGEKETIIKLDDGRMAKGIDAVHYSDPTNIALARYVGPGLEVVAEIDKPNGKTVEAFKIVKESSAIALAPLDGRARKPLLYVPADHWYLGTIHTPTKGYNCRILLVVLEISTQHNADYV